MYTIRNMRYILVGSVGEARSKPEKKVLRKKRGEIEIKNRLQAVHMHGDAIGDFTLRTSLLR